MNKSLFWFWAIFNLFIGIWEVYAYTNRDKLVLTKDSIWKKISNGYTTFNTFWLDAWSEYCKVDSRYIKQYSNMEYVWFFELSNFILAVIFLLFLLFFNNNNNNNTNNISRIKLILLLSIINCSCYYLTLLIEIYKNKVILDNITKYASNWNIIIYYLICSIWLIIPIFLYMNV
jgi:hypothetical protein